MSEEEEKSLKEAFRLCYDVEDPVKEPYRSKYKASEMLEVLSKKHPDEAIRNLASGRRGLIYAITEEKGRAKTCLENVLKYFCPQTQSKEFEMKLCLVDDISERILPFASDVMKFYNVLSTLHYSSENASWHHDLEVSLSIYSQILELRKKQAVVKEDSSSLSSLSGCWDNSVDGQAALSLFYLAQMISKRGQKGDRELSATFLYRTLEMRLSQLLKDMNSTRAIDWSSCVHGMAQYHRMEGNKIRALSLIECAEKMLRRCTNVSDWKETERFRDVRAKLSRLRGMLYLDSMRAAVKKEEDKDEVVFDVAISDTTRIPKAFPRCEDTTSSSSLQLLDPSYIRSNLPESMRAAFRVARSGLENSLKHFKLEGYVSQHVEISRELCKAYSYVALGENEKNHTMKIKIHRRMIKILDPIFKCLNQDVYQDTCIVLAFELAEICVSLQMIKETQLKETNSTKPDSIARVRKYAEDAANYFDTFCDLVEKEGRGDVSEDRVISYVRAKLHCARMIIKMTLGFKDMKEKVDSIRSACERLRSLQDFAIKHIIVGSEIHSALKEELRLCHESLNVHSAFLKQFGG